MSEVVLKDPDAEVDHSFNWDDGYLDDTTSPPESISTSTWAVSPADSPGLTISSDSKTLTVATAFFLGGVVEQLYVVTNTVTTSGGRTDERSLSVRMEER